MRLGPFEISRPRAATTVAPDTPAQAAASRERGASGTINQQGFLVQDEYNPDLRDDRALQTWERMRRSDASVREALMHIVAPILNASWEVEPAGSDPLDLEIAEFVRRAYMEWTSVPFQVTLRQQLNHLATGFQVFELVEQVVEAELSWDDPSTGQQVTGGRRQFVTWRRWAHRKPSTIWKWNLEQGELVSVTQQVWKTDGYVTPTIPADQLVVFTNEQEGDDFTGVSILRTAYKAWWLKEVIEKVMGVAIERHGVGIPTVYVPEDAKRDDALLDRVEEMLAGLKAGEFSYMVFPGPKATAGAGGANTNGGFFFEIVAPTGGIPDFTGPLEYLRGEIKGNVLARFAELGHGSTGARATGDVQSQVWYSALHAVAGYVSEQHQPAIRRLVDKNYRTDRYPSLVARDIETRSLQEFADANAKLVAAGAVLPDRSYRQSVRKAIDAPGEDDDAERQLEQNQPPVEEDPTGPPGPQPPPAKPNDQPADLGGTQ